MIQQTCHIALRKRIGRTEQTKHKKYCDTFHRNFQRPIEIAPEGADPDSTLTSAQQLADTGSGAGNCQRHYGDPYPPPPGVSTTNTSPGRSSVLSCGPSRLLLPSARSTQFIPRAPASRPANPTRG